MDGMGPWVLLSSLKGKRYTNKENIGERLAPAILEKNTVGLTRPDFNTYYKATKSRYFNTGIRIDV